MSEGGGVGLGMAGRLRLTKCCCCLSLEQGARVLGAVLLLLTLGKFLRLKQLTPIISLINYEYKSFQIFLCLSHMSIPMYSRHLLNSNQCQVKSVLTVLAFIF